MLLATDHARDRLTAAQADLTRTAAVGALATLVAAALAVLGGDGWCVAIAVGAVAPIGWVAARDAVRLVTAAVLVRRVGRRPAGR